MIYQHPLAYLLGLEGLALLRAWAGDYDREFVQARLAEVRRLLADESLSDHAGVMVRRGNSRTGYRQWSPTYDDSRAGGLFDIDEPVVHAILGAMPTATVLDAACGTGRFAAYLASQGHRVIGVDSSPEMLARARVRVPQAEFLLGDLEELPLPDDAVEVVVCALALAHLPVLEPLVLRGSVVKALRPDGRPELVATYRHTAGDFLRAALPVGLQVRRFEEPQPSSGDEPARPAPQTSPGSREELASWEGGDGKAGPGRSWTSFPRRPGLPAATH